MAWNEAAYLTEHNATTALSDLTAAIVSTARQNIAAAQSTMPSDDAARQHDSLSEISSIYSRALEGRRWSSWSGDE